MADAHIHRIATAVPNHMVHGVFVSFAQGMLTDARKRMVFDRMVDRSEIERRYSVLALAPSQNSHAINAYDFYRSGNFPSTGERMRLFEKEAPELLRRTLDKLHLTEKEAARVKHVIVTCCTGHYAPGLDFTIIEHLGLSQETSRTMIGFMGCYAAINGLRQARDIVRSNPGDSVLLVNLEICSLHLQETQDLGEMLSFLLFADGCAAALISAEEDGLRMDSFRSVSSPDTRDLITWRIDNQGFLMHLSGQVPSAIEELLHLQSSSLPQAKDIALWAVHPGGKTVLDAVERGLSLAPEALSASRQVLRQFGNMSSATVMFVLHELMQSASPGNRGLAIAFGPGLTAETMAFHAV